MDRVIKFYSIIWIFAFFLFFIFSGCDMLVPNSTFVVPEESTANNLQFKDPSPIQPNNTLDEPEESAPDKLQFKYPAPEETPDFNETRFFDNQECLILCSEPEVTDPARCRLKCKLTCKKKCTEEISATPSPQTIPSDSPEPPIVSPLNTALEATSIETSVDMPVETPAAQPPTSDRAGDDFFCVKVQDDLGCGCSKCWNDGSGCEWKGHQCVTPNCLCDCKDASEGC